MNASDNVECKSREMILMERRIGLVVVEQQVKVVSQDLSKTKACR